MGALNTFYGLPENSLQLLPGWDSRQPFISSKLLQLSALSYCDNGAFLSVASLSAKHLGRYSSVAQLNSACLSSSAWLLKRPFQNRSFKQQRRRQNYPGRSEKRQKDTGEIPAVLYWEMLTGENHQTHRNAGFPHYRADAYRHAALLRAVFARAVGIDQRNA